MRARAASSTSAPTQQVTDKSLLTDAIAEAERNAGIDISPVCWTDAGRDEAHKYACTVSATTSSRQLVLVASRLRVVCMCGGGNTSSTPPPKGLSGGHTLPFSAQRYLPNTPILDPKMVFPVSTN